MLEIDNCKSEVKSQFFLISANKNQILLLVAIDKNQHFRLRLVFGQE